MKHYDGTLGGDGNIFKGALIVRTGDGSETHINPCIAAYVWHPGGIAEGVRLSIDNLRELRPDAVVLHSGTADLLANLRRAVAATRLALDGPGQSLDVWVGLGIDGTIEAWRNGKLTNAQVVTRYTAVATLCEAIGWIKVLVLNGESKWALKPGNARSVADVKQLAHELGEAMVKAAPSIVFALSSFGRLGHHADVRALIEGLTPHCSVFTGQSYAARPGAPVKGVLPAILKKDESSQEATERQGWLRPDDVDADGDDVADDLDRVATVQGHKTNPTDLCKAACERYHIIVWALPMLDEHGRFDREGLDAIRAALAIRRHWTGAGPGSVAAYQREVGLVPIDGVPGKGTRAHALAHRES